MILQPLPPGSGIVFGNISLLGGPGLLALGGNALKAAADAMIEKGKKLAAEAACARLILFHHEPEHNDSAIDRLLKDTRQYATRVAPGLEVEAAAEGMQFSL